MQLSNISKFALGALLIGASTLAINAAEAVAEKPAPAPAPAPATAPAAETAPAAKRAEYFVGVSAGGQFTDFSNGRTKGGSLFGASLQAGGYLSKSRAVLKDLLLFADVGLYSGSWTDTMHENIGPYPYDGYELVGHDYVYSSLYRKSELMNIPVLVTLAYDFRPCDSLSLKIGPSVGITYASVKSKLDGRDDIYSNADVLIGIEPHSENVSNSKVLFTCGLTLGASWVFAKNWSADLQYRFQVTDKMKFGHADLNYGISTTHQVNLGVSYRF